MNKTETKQIQFKKDVEQEQILGYWIRRYGITKRDLDTHPQINDLMLLIKFRSEFWDMNSQFKKKFERSWDWVYNHKMPLKKNHLNNLTRIGKAITKWRKNRQDKIEIIKAHRQRIKGN
jgi:hypothetical protein